MAVTEVAQPEPGEVCNYDEEAQHRQEHEERGEKQTCEHSQWGFESAKAGRTLGTDRWSRVGKGHNIFDGLDWL